MEKTLPQIGGRDAGPSGLGKKITCPSCHKKFYDLNRIIETCPKCLVAFNVGSRTQKEVKTTSSISIFDQARGMEEPFEGSDEDELDMDDMEDFGDLSGDGPMEDDSLILDEDQTDEFDDDDDEDF